MSKIKKMQKKNLVVPKDEGCGKEYPWKTLKAMAKELGLSRRTLSTRMSVLDLGNKRIWENKRKE